jgi:hypothetical protein
MPLGCNKCPGAEKQCRKCMCLKCPDRKGDVCPGEPDIENCPYDDNGVRK